MRRLPPWIRASLKTDKAYGQVCGLLADLDLHTVCASAQCPNRHECWNKGTATFMIMGDVCTRNCTFCAVQSGAPQPLDPGEPRQVAQAAQSMRLNHVVITSVTRDDLPDGGAAFFAECIQALRETLPSVSVEVLVPDFGGQTASIDAVLAARPDVFNHNMETVRRLQPIVRSQADYARSLGVLRHAASREPAVLVKTGLMVGLGETMDELNETMRDILATGCSMLTIGQYLAPSRAHQPVVDYLEPDVFRVLRETALDLGFRAVASAPLVRSSYKADELMRQAR